MPVVDSTSSLVVQKLGTAFWHMLVDLVMAALHPNGFHLLAVKWHQSSAFRVHRVEETAHSCSDLRLACTTVRLDSFPAAVVAADVAAAVAAVAATAVPAQEQVFCASRLELGHDQTFVAFGLAAVDARNCESFADCSRRDQPLHILGTESPQLEVKAE